MVMFKYNYIQSFDWKSAVQHDEKCVIVYLAGDNPAIVMYCVYGESCSSPLIESTVIIFIDNEAEVYIYVIHARTETITIVL